MITITRGRQYENGPIESPDWPLLPLGTVIDQTWPAIVVEFGPGPPCENPCRVYWGSHGCDFERGHDGDHDCGCCECENHPDPDSGCVGRTPFYGPDTRFYGEDAEALGLPLAGDA